MTQGSAENAEMNDEAWYRAFEKESALRKSFNEGRELCEGGDLKPVNRALIYDVLALGGPESAVELIKGFAEAMGEPETYLKPGNLEFYAFEHLKSLISSLKPELEPNENHGDMDQETAQAFPTARNELSSLEAQLPALEKQFLRARIRAKFIRLGEGMPLADTIGYILDINSYIAELEGMGENVEDLRSELAVFEKTKEYAIETIGRTREGHMPKILGPFQPTIGAEFLEYGDSTGDRECLPCMEPHLGCHCTASEMQDGDGDVYSSIDTQRTTSAYREESPDTESPSALAGLSPENFQAYILNKSKGNPRAARRWLEVAYQNNHFKECYQTLDQYDQWEIQAIFTEYGMDHLAKALAWQGKDLQMKVKSSDQIERELEQMIKEMKREIFSITVFPRNLRASLKALKRSGADSARVAHFEAGVSEALKINAMKRLDDMVNSLQETGVYVYGLIELSGAIKDAEEAGVDMSAYEKYLPDLKRKMAQDELDHVIEYTLNRKGVLTVEDLSEVMVQAREVGVPMEKYDRQFLELVDILESNKNRWQSQLQSFQDKEDNGWED